MKQPILLVLAAGMGSRYGGLKQIDPVGPNGEVIIHYSIFDAIRAGFQRFLFIIKEENREAFDEIVLSHLPRSLDIDIVYQDMEDVPDGFVIPEERVKPWGTAHALHAARTLLDAPFAVINADDYYGPEGFAKVYDFLTRPDARPECHAMVGFQVRNTVTENGSVARGICEVEDGKLRRIVERKQVFQEGDGARFTDENGQEVHLSGDTPVSMNFWGFRPEFMEAIEQEIARFFAEDVAKDPLKAEALLPTAVGEQLKAGKAEVEVLTTGDRWMGVTYREDKERVASGFRQMAEDGVYPSPLWK